MKAGFDGPCAVGSFVEVDGGQDAFAGGNSYSVTVGGEVVNGDGVNQAWDGSLKNETSSASLVNIEQGNVV